MKKTISIGIALALLAMVVVPAAVGAQTIQPATYAKIPFTMVQSGFYLVGCLLGQLQPILTAANINIPITLSDLTPIFKSVGDWAGGPLSWSVDMLGWGIGLLASVVTALQPANLGIPAWISDLLTTVQTSLNECVAPSLCNNVTLAYTPPC